MSKELKALERLKTAPNFMGGTAEYKSCTKSEILLIQDYEVIKQALQRLEAIDSIESSEALECLEEIGKTLMFTDYETLESKPLKEVMPNYYNTIKQALIKAQEQEKVLENEQDN